jgi:hypothetical protein
MLNPAIGLRLVCGSPPKDSFLCVCALQDISQLEDPVSSHVNRLQSIIHDLVLPTNGNAVCSYKRSLRSTALPRLPAGFSSDPQLRAPVLTEASDGIAAAHNLKNHVQSA